MNAKEEYVVRFLDGSDKKFVIPVYQRPYSWTNDEINELFNDIIDYFNNKPEEEMFIGTVYLSLCKQIKTSISQYDINDRDNYTY